MKERKMNYKVIDGVAYDEHGDALFLEENKKDFKKYTFFSEKSQDFQTSYFYKLY